MDIVVVGKQDKVDAALRTLTTEKVERVGKFANDVRRVEVEYEHHPTRRADDSHTCEILVHVRQHLVKGTAAGTEYAVALDRAVDKVDQQMRRLHERRVGRRNGSKARGARASGDGSAAALGGVDGELDAAHEVQDSSRELVKTKQFSVKPMDSEEAALQMELLGHDFFLFTSAETGGASVIYRRRDGRLGLIEATG
jgi:ribosomal subunit interface protein